MSKCQQCEYYKKNIHVEICTNPMLARYPWIGPFKLDFDRPKAPLLKTATDPDKYLCLTHGGEYLFFQPKELTFKEKLTNAYYTLQRFAQRVLAFRSSSRLSS